MALWFDVGIKRYTTFRRLVAFCLELWFDVGIKRYTTVSFKEYSSRKLWFDVGIKRYTTGVAAHGEVCSCGLM